MEAPIFSEAVKTKKDGEDYLMTAKIVPFGKISRNNVMYDKESVLNTHSKLVGKPVLYNHKANEGLPRGEWVGTEIRTDGMYGTAKIYNTNYNKDLIEYLSHASSPTVSLEVVGDAEKRINEETGKQYGLAKVRDWLEASIVNVPGFEEAKILSFECVIAESLGLGIQSLDSNGGIPVSDFKEIFDRLDKHEALMEKIVGYLEKFNESKKVEDKKEIEEKCKENVEVKVEEVKSEAKAEDKKEDEKKEEVKSEAKVEDKKEDEKKEEVKSEAKVEDKKEDEKKEEVKSEAKAEKEDSKEDKKEDEKEAKEEDKKEEMVQKEEVRTVDERDNKPDMAKKDDEKKQDKLEEPVKKEEMTVETKAEEVKSEAKVEDKKEEDKPKEPEVVKEAAKVKKMNESFSRSNERVVWSEMLKRHFGN